MKNPRFPKPAALMITCAWTVLGPSLALQAAPESMGITALVKERVKTLEQLVELTRRRYQTGQATIDDYLSAEGELLEARVEMTPDHQTRVALLGTLVGNLKRTEALAKERVASGVAPREEILRAKAARLTAEVRLARVLETERGCSNPLHDR